MAWRRLFYLVGIVAVLVSPSLAPASEYHGQVIFGGFPLPGATVTVTQGTKKLTTISDQGGLYTFPDLADGSWKVEITMLCFSTAQGDLTVSSSTPAGKWELTLLPLDEITKLANLPPPPVVAAAVPAPAPAKKPGTNDTPVEIPKPAEDANANDGFLVNGSVNNAATSRYSLDRAFGNRRYNTKSLYTGGLAAILDNSALDARPYSLSGLNSPKASYNRIRGVLTLGGPIHIPKLMPRRGPTFFLGYVWTRNRTAETESGLVPTLAERIGDLSGLVNPLGQPLVVYDPATQQPYPGNIVPVSAQAAALLQLYPKPDFAGNSLYNYQVPILNSTHEDLLQFRLDQTIGRRDEVYGGFNLQSTRSSGSSLFLFTDKTQTLGINTNINWSHRFNQRLFFYGGYQFTRLRTNIVPYFANRQNISGEAGITGNNQDATNWGPPTLAFSSGITSLTDQNSSFNRNRSDRFNASVAIYRGRHNITLGGDLRKQQWNDFFQANPRGTFTFTGAATQGTGSTGSDLADFLIGVPDTSAAAFGNADKYLRAPAYDLYGTDDWRILPNLTIDAGLRWDYGAPITELKDRLVNLDVLTGFTGALPVLASDPVGILTGNRYPSSLIRPDKRGFQPRVGISWRPIPASTVVVRAGYGIYDDTSIYETVALALAQQFPLSKSLSVANSSSCRLTLANGFDPCPSVTSNTFAVDPNFRVGYAQTWNLSVQRDLPAALQATVTYLGIKGTRGVQQFLPNTYPIGASTTCTDCPAGFVYESSGGDSTRQSGQVQLRRRLRSGFTASLLYTFSKSIDDDASLGGEGHTVAAQSQGSTGPSGGQSQGGGTSGGGGGQSAAPPTTSTPTAAIAQDWLNLHAERSLSSFDQRHLLNLQVQYTTGEGLGGGTLMNGWRGRFYKEWTVLTQVTVGTGLPQTPVFLAAVPGTGVTGTIRPNPTGAPIYAAPAGLHLNSAAYAAPLAGQWGTAGRNSITGPGQFSLDTSLMRTFRLTGRFTLDGRIDATNLLNHPVFSDWITTINSTQFGLPLAANPMRSLETTLRLRF